MKNIIRLLVLSMIVGMILLLAGCTEETTAPTPLPIPSTEIKTIQPKGFISGKIIDRCTGMAITGAVVSLGYGDTAHYFTSEDGSFAFANVPAGQYEIIDGYSVWSGTYMITMNMKNVNLAQTDPLKRYRDYYYQTVTILFTSLVPGDSLGVSGLVGSAVCTLSTLSTTLKGTVVDQSLIPVAAANVIILDHATSIVLAQTTTGTDGSFQFQNLENGSSFEIRVKSAEGGLQATVDKSLLCNQSSDSLRTQVLVEQIVLAPVDNVAPFIISVSPDNNADVAVGTSIVYTFSEPIKQVPYTVTTLGKGHGTIVDNIHVNYVSLKKSTADVPMTSIAWSNNNTVLTVVPSGLVGSAKYRVTFDTVAIKANLKDLAGNTLVNNSLLTGDLEGLNFTTGGGTTGPAAPVLSRRIVQNFTDSLDFVGGVVGLEWTPVAGARSYNIYQSVGNGSFELARADVYRTQDTLTSAWLVTPQNVANPLAAIAVNYQVRAVGADLVEGTASNNIPITDQVKPTLDTVIVATGDNTNPPAIYWWRYMLQFSEPLTVAAAQTIANYAILNTDSVTFAITKADYLGFDATSTSYQVQLMASSNLPAPTGLSVRALAGITDLAGNAIDVRKDLIALSVPRTPTLSAPADAAAAVGLPATLSWGSANGWVSFRLQVATDLAMTTLVFDREITSTSYAVSNAYLTGGITYYWRVYANNKAGTSAASVVRSFTP